MGEPTVEPLTGLIVRNTRDDGREEVILSDVRPVPAWAGYATKMTQGRADEVRSEVAAMNGLSNERGRGDGA